MKEIQNQIHCTEIKCWIMCTVWNSGWFQLRINKGQSVLFKCIYWMCCFMKLTIWRCYLCVIIQIWSQKTKKNLIFLNNTWLPISERTMVAQWLRCCATHRKVAGSIPAGVSGFFIDIKSFWSHYGPGVDTASNRNEYQEYFLGLKAAGA